MRALKVKLYQPFACYSTPFSFGAVNTYLLPPPSTVKGFVHSTAGARQDYPISVAIQGELGGTVYELQKLLKFDRKRAGQPELKGFSRSLLKAPTYVETLTDVHLTLYILFPPESEELEKDFLNGLLLKEFPSLGRKEDIARLEEEPRFVELDPLEEETVLPSFAYFTRETATELGLGGAFYRLPLSYDGELAKELGWRFFKRRDLLLAPPGQVVEPLSDKVLYDPSEDRVVELIEVPAGYKHVLS
ncbi:CRISPR-associated protein Cas5 [Thermovibrio ammonificans]